MSHRITRRSFQAGMVATGAALTGTYSACADAASDEPIRLGFIGVGNRGDQLLDAFAPHADAKVTALCDVYEPYLEFAAAKVGGAPFLTGDFRELLARDDVDAVVIATPDHWHAIPFIAACEAGKDVYVEKPLSLVVDEGKAMVAAARKHRRVTQVGIHRRSASACAELVRRIRAGAIGKLTAVRCFHITNEWPLGIGDTPDTDPPAGLDWDMWLGPAPAVAYNEKRCLYKFRWFREYSGGQMTNFGTHWLDLIQWAIGQDAPTGVFAIGSNATIQDGRGIPDTMEAVWDYADGTIVSFSQYNANSAGGTAQPGYIEFRGTKGTLYYSSRGATIVPEQIRTEPLPALDPTAREESYRQARATTQPADVTAETIARDNAGPVEHARDFLDCIRTRGTCRCPVEVGHRSTVATLIANIACDLKKYLQWDAANERFTNDDEANAALAYAYRPPWQFPRT